MALRFKSCSCKIEIISLPTAYHKWINVDAVSLSEADKHEIAFGYSVIFNNKRHVPHFTTCPLIRKKRFPHVDKAPVIYE